MRPPPWRGRVARRPPPPRPRRGARRAGASAIRRSGPPPARPSSCPLRLHVALEPAQVPGLGCRGFGDVLAGLEDAVLLDHEPAFVPPLAEGTQYAAEVHLAVAQLA